jgi:hypothetical protein
MLLPVALGDTAWQACLPASTQAAACKLGHFVAENAKSARAELKRMGHPGPLRDLAIEQLPENANRGGHRTPARPAGRRPRPRPDVRSRLPGDRRPGRAAGSGAPTIKGYRRQAAGRAVLPAARADGIRPGGPALRLPRLPAGARTGARPTHRGTGKRVGQAEDKRRYSLKPPTATMCNVRGGVVRMPATNPAVRGDRPDARHRVCPHPPHRRLEGRSAARPGPAPHRFPPAGGPEMPNDVKLLQILDWDSPRQNALLRDELAAGLLQAAGPHCPEILLRRARLAPVRGHYRVARVLPNAHRGGNLSATTCRPYGRRWARISR